MTGGTRYFTTALGMRQIPLRLWRVSHAEPSGLHVWFDPKEEVVIILRKDELWSDGTPRADGGVPCEGGDADHEAQHGGQVDLEGVLEPEDPLPF